MQVQHGLCRRLQSAGMLRLSHVRPSRCGTLACSVLAVTRGEGQSAGHHRFLLSSAWAATGAAALVSAHLRVAMLDAPSRNIWASPSSRGFAGATFISMIIAAVVPICCGRRLHQVATHSNVVWHEQCHSGLKTPQR